MIKMSSTILPQPGERGAAEATEVYRSAAAKQQVRDEAGHP